MTPTQFHVEPRVCRVGKLVALGYAADVFSTGTFAALLSYLCLDVSATAPRPSAALWPLAALLAAAVCA